MNNNPLVNLVENDAAPAAPATLNANAAETLAMDLEDSGKDPGAITEQDLIEMGYSPIRAWAADGLVVFESSPGVLQDVGMR